MAAVAGDLADVADLVDMPLQVQIVGAYAINLPKSAEVIDVSIACGNSGHTGVDFLEAACEARSIPSVCMMRPLGHEDYSAMRRVMVGRLNDHPLSGSLWWFALIESGGLAAAVVPDRFDRQSTLPMTQRLCCF
jgi:hypothetical protein